MKESQEIVTIETLRSGVLPVSTRKENRNQAGNVTLTADVRSFATVKAHLLETVPGFVAMSAKDRSALAVAEMRKHNGDALERVAKFAQVGATVTRERFTVSAKGKLTHSITQVVEAETVEAVLKAENARLRAELAAQTNAKLKAPKAA